jgi:broad specificity phosphatase PhoE
MNAESRWAGDTDTPLSEQGIEATRKLASNLAGFGISALFSSSLTRAQHTATILNDYLHAEYLGPVSELNERNIGAWTGLSYHELAQAYPEELHAWTRGESREIPGAERWSALSARAVRGLGIVQQRSKSSEVVLAVTHAQVLSAICDTFGFTHVKQHNLEGHWLRLTDDSVQYLEAFSSSRTQAHYCE